MRAADGSARPGTGSFLRTIPALAFIGTTTPEVSITVVPDRRGRGIGADLLAALIEQGRDGGFRALSLSVSSENPAVALYRRHGFVRVHSRDEHWTMRLDVDGGAA